MNVLVIAEHDNHQVKDATLHAVSAAKQLADDVTVIVAGYQCDAVAKQAATISNVSKVIVADAKCYQHQLAENLSLLLTEIAKGFTHIIAPATSFGKNLLPRLAALLDVEQYSDIRAIISDNVFMRPIYAGNACVTVEALDPIKVVSIRTTAFEAATMRESSAEIEQLSTQHDAKLSRFVKHEISNSARPELTSARVVVSGGRALESAENFKLLDGLADRLNAAIGASRAAVDAGYVSNDHQVGQTGKVVAPELYIAIGISGAIQHLAGMKDSKVIVAINKDPAAPIFKVADYGLVGDLFEVVPELVAELDKFI